MSEELATSPRLDGEAPTVEERLADILEGAGDVYVDDYRMSNADRAKIVAALRSVATRGVTEKMIQAACVAGYGVEADQDSNLHRLARALRAALLTATRVKAS